FKNALAKYEAIAAKLVTTAGRRSLEQRQTTTKLLVQFKAQLASDISAHPVDGAALQTRTGAKISGRLVRATDAQMIFATPYGELVNDWRELTPESLMRLGESYAVATVRTEKPEARARRYLMLAVFCKQYGMDRAAAGY